MTEPVNSQSLSGIMLRGMSGNNAKKDAASVPFLALHLPEARSLKTIDPVKLEHLRRADPLYRLHSDGDLIVGSVEEAWDEELTAYCRNLFKVPSVVDAFQTRHSQIIFTVPQNDLRDIDELSEEYWRPLSAKRLPAPAAGR